MDEIAMKENVNMPVSFVVLLLIRHHVVLSKKIGSPHHWCARAPFNNTPSAARCRDATRLLTAINTKSTHSDPAGQATGGRGSGSTRVFFIFIFSFSRQTRAAHRYILVQV
jgi:hypothetical protein